MGRPDIPELIQQLQEQHFRASRAFPGSRMPHIQVPAVAVALEEETGSTVTLAVTVFYPEHMGGGGCEDEAARLAAYLRRQGYACTQGKCSYDGKSDRFYVQILAKWQERTAQTLDSVSISGVFHPRALRFSARQQSELEETASGYTVTPGRWRFTLEEQIPPGEKEAAAPAEPFAVVVHRGTVTEQYGDCRWTDRQREDTSEGLHLVYAGIAGSRSVQ